MYRLVSPPAENFPAALAWLGWPPKGFYLFLDKKVAKNQGLELMSDKIVKALFRQHKHPMKDRAKCAALDSGGLKNCG